MFYIWSETGPKQARKKLEQHREHCFQSILILRRKKLQHRQLQQDERKKLHSEKHFKNKEATTLLQAILRRKKNR